MISLRIIVVPAIDRAGNKSVHSICKRGVELHNSDLLTVIPDLNRIAMRKLEDKGIHTLTELRAVRIEDRAK